MSLDLAKAELANFLLKGNFEENWNDVWSSPMKQLIKADELEIEMFSETIRDLFLSANSGKGRRPEQAGLQWRRFLWCTLSLLTAGTNNFVVCGHPMIKKVLPNWMRDKLKISIGEGRGLTHEPDLVLVKIKQPYVNSIEWSNFNPDLLCEHLNSNPNQVLELVVLWTKTNFNDLIQQPMLWARISMLHQTGSSPPVRHAFVTLPSQKLHKFRPGTTPFVRASTFDYGGFWGIGKSEIFGMGSIFDIIPDWKERFLESENLDTESMLFEKLRLID
jgi:hypothetical protein